MIKKVALIVLATFLALAGLPASGLCAPSHDGCAEKGTGYFLTVGQYAKSSLSPFPELCCSSAEDASTTFSSTLPAKPVFAAQGALFQSPAQRVTALSLFAGRRIAPSAESPPSSPFYRTTFANHAPPVSLA